MSDSQTVEQLESLVEEWHAEDDPRPLQEFLGLQDEEMSSFLRGDQA